MIIPVTRTWALVFRAALAATVALGVPLYHVEAQAREGYAVTDDSVKLWYRVVGQGRETVLIPVGLFYGTRRHQSLARQPDP